MLSQAAIEYPKDILQTQIFILTLFDTNNYMTFHHQFYLQINLAIQQTGHNGWNRNCPSQTAWGIQW